MKLDSPEACSRELAACAANGDLDCIAEIFEEDAVFVHEDGTLVTGREAIREMLAGFTKARPVLEIRIARAFRTGGDLAVLHLEWSYESLEPDGSKVPNAGASVQVVRRQPDGSWRLVYDDHGFSAP